MGASGITTVHALGQRLHLVGEAAVLARLGEAALEHLLELLAIADPQQHHAVRDHAPVARRGEVEADLVAEGGEELLPHVHPERVVRLREPLVEGGAAAGEELLGHLGELLDERGQVDARADVEAGVRRRGLQKLEAAVAAVEQAQEAGRRAVVGEREGVAHAAFGVARRVAERLDAGEHFFASGGTQFTKMRPARRRTRRRERSPRRQLRLKARHAGAEASVSPEPRHCSTSAAEPPPPALPS